MKKALTKSKSNKIKNEVSGRQDSNLRPPAPKAGAMTGLRYVPKKKNAHEDNNFFTENACRPSFTGKKAPNN